MNGRNWVLCCAVGGILMTALSFRAPAQESGDFAGERSVLAAERTPEAAANRRDFCRCIGETESASVDRIELALRSPLKSAGLDMVDTPLEEVVNFLQDDYEIAIQLDLPALEENGLGPDEPVTINLYNISLRSALRLMLKSLNLTYVIRDEVLMITTPEEAESLLITCVYDLRGIHDAGTTTKALIDTITSCVATETWAVHGGGEAKLQSLEPGLLVVAQTQAVHNEISELLSAIRAMRREAPDLRESAESLAPDSADRVVTRSYVLQIPRSDESITLSAKVRDLIVQSLPDQRWKGRLDDGQAVILAVLPDRIVLRHKQSVQDEVEALLSESGVAAAGSAGMRGGASGGGGGGGFFQPDRAEND